MTRAWQAAQCTEDVGANVRHLLVDRMRYRAERSVREQCGRPLRRFLGKPQREAANLAARELVDVVVRDARLISPSLSTRLRYAVLTLARRHPGWSWHGFASASTSPYDLDWLEAACFLHESAGRTTALEPLRGLRMLSANCGWLLPHENVCWLSERPIATNFDIRGRLHGANGPALAYPDGWTHYAWRGLEVPATLIESPHRITLAAIDGEPDPVMRRTMIDILTPQRYIALGGAIYAGRDETGVLWRKTWITGDSWAAVEVVNGSLQPDGTRQHYFLQVPPEVRTPRAAVAWTYGMREDEYAKLVVRT